ncbi:nucleotide exchange factor GrpE [Desemzia sp. RIT804]|nr:nucleotide exchange factor GrpE [Desemzia sp. RIT 804]MBM6613894.1 nucleotide exchange factor GrpE [Desemzia sp. RIT 804]
MTTKKELCIVEDKDSHLEKNESVDDLVNEELDTETASEETVEEFSTEDSTDELAQLQAALEEKEDAYLRLQAELANIQKRNRKERETDAKYRSQSLAKELINVLDNLERALMIETSAENETFKKGIEMVYASFKSALESEGVQVVDPLNEAFDPNYHQAVQTVAVEDGQEAGTVVTVHQKGYTLHERVLRPAMVVVAQ